MSRIRFEDYLESEEEKIEGTTSVGKLSGLKESYKAKLARINVELEEGNDLKEGRRLFLRGRRKFLTKLLSHLKTRRRFLASPPKEEVINSGCRRVSSSLQ